MVHSSVKFLFSNLKRITFFTFLGYAVLSIMKRIPLSLEATDGKDTFDVLRNMFTSSTATMDAVFDPVFTLVSSENNRHLHFFQSLASTCFKALNLASTYVVNSRPIYIFFHVMSSIFIFLETFFLFGLVMSLSRRFLSPFFQIFGVAADFTYLIWLGMLMGHCFVVGAIIDTPPSLLHEPFIDLTDAMSDISISRYDITDSFDKLQNDTVNHDNSNITSPINRLGATTQHSATENITLRSKTLENSDTSSSSIPVSNRRAGNLHNQANQTHADRPLFRPIIFGPTASAPAVFRSSTHRVNHSQLQQPIGFASPPATPFATSFKGSLDAVSPTSKKGLSGATDGTPNVLSSESRATTKSKVEKLIDIENGN